MMIGLTSGFKIQIDGVVASLLIPSTERIRSDLVLLR